MRDIQIAKVVINMGVGESGKRLRDAEHVLYELTGQKPIRTIAKRTAFGVGRGEPIGCKVTLRGDKAEDFLRRALDIKGISQRNFDAEGNISFGIDEHIDFPNVKYDPEVGIFGMDISVVMERPGYRISRRKRERRKIPRGHRVAREDAISFMQEFGAKIS